MSEQTQNVTPINEAIYFESCLTSTNDPAQTLYNYSCMLSMLGTKELSGQFPEEAAVGFGLIMHQVELALDDISERYDFVEKKSN